MRSSSAASAALFGVLLAHAFSVWAGAVKLRVEMQNPDCGQPVCPVLLRVTASEPAAAARTVAIRCEVQVSRTELFADVGTQRRRNAQVRQEAIVDQAGKLDTVVAVTTLTRRSSGDLMMNERVTAYSCSAE